MNWIQLNRLLIFGFLFFSAVLPALSFTPMEYYNSLVAGSNDIGYRDGDFDKARFNRPCGIAFDDSGDRLFVADSDNNRIRVIYPNEKNRVETLAGTGDHAQKDGPLLEASFDQPRSLVLIPGDRLIVYEEGSKALREIDLRSKTVTTLAKTSQIWNMVYRAQDDSLYFSEPFNDANALQKLDMKTKEISTVLYNNPQVPHPKALCLTPDKLYLADADLPTVYEVHLDKDPVSNKISANLISAGAGNRILELTYSDGVLYALQMGPASLAQILPSYRSVVLPTPWVYLTKNDSPEAEALLRFDSFPYTVGFAASPREPRKLFISSPNPDYAQSVISVKDYNFDGTWPAQSAPDFEYPTKKPAKTFRILVVGDSRLVTAPTAVNKGDGPTLNAEGETMSWRVNTFPKQLEFLLNAEAALQGVDTHYEVLMLGHVNECPLFFSQYEVPDLVQKYDVDMVCMMTSLYYLDYFVKPINKEGTPVLTLDPEFLSKPLASRVPPGAPGQFYKHCKTRGSIKPGSPFPGYISLLKLDDPEIRGDLMEMMGLPLRLISKKLNAISLKNGAAPDFLMLNIPWDQFAESGCKNEDFALFWKDLCGKSDVKLLDIGDSFNLLRTSFYPTQQECCAKHYTAYGHALIAYLLSRSLIADRLIPFAPEPPNNATRPLNKISK